MKFTHQGLTTSRACIRREDAKTLPVELRETKKFWVSLSGMKFWKQSGDPVEESVWILDLQSIKPKVEK